MYEELNKSELLMRSKKTGWYYILNESDNYGYDCYYFDNNKNFMDGFIPFCADDATEEDTKAINKWNEMDISQRIKHCLFGMNVSFYDCEVIDDEQLHEELMENI